MNPALQRLANCSSVLIAGAGGGFDVFCGLPLLFWLRTHGVEVVLGNLSFTDLDSVAEPWLAPAVKRVAANSRSDQTYFPEKHLTRWFAEQGEERVVYCFSRTGVRFLRSAYEEIMERHEVDAVVLADGGTDSLLRGDEDRLGTPHEDMLSIAAVHGLDVETKILVSVGFGVDAYHGVCHAHVLESIAALMGARGYLGSLGLVSEMPEVRAFLEALSFVCAAPGQRPSIVNASIAAALEGKFGNIDPTGRTRGDTFWLNPLMSLMWFFDVQAVARHSLYLPLLEGTETFSDVKTALLEFRLSTRERRGRQPIPH